MNVISVQSKSAYNYREDAHCKYRYYENMAAYQMSLVIKININRSQYQMNDKQ